MKNRKLKLVANVSGFDVVVAEVKIQNFADEVDVKEWTELVCPECNEKPMWKGGYVCEGKHEARMFNHWSKLKRVIKGTAKALSIPRLLAEKEEAVGNLFWLTTEEFAKQYVDATRKEEGEKGVVLADEKYANLLFKLLVAVEQLNYVVVAKWKDTNEEVIALITVSVSGRILIREIIPSNLAKVKPTLFIDRNAITEQDVAEAKAFVTHFIPKATEQTFEVNDYRAQWKAGVPTQAIVPEPQKVIDIAAILKQHQIVVEAPKPKKKKVK